MTTPTPAESTRYRFFARWGDMDFNAHMRNTAYLDVSGDVRMLYFASQGFSTSDFMKQRIGPVILRDELEYFKELHLLEPYDVTLTLLEMSEDGGRFRLCNEFFRADGGQPVARVTSSGGWLNLDTRRLTAPPEALRAAMGLLPRR